MDWMTLAGKIEMYIERGDTETCLNRVAAALEKMPKTDFHRVLDAEFSNSPQQVADWFDRFLREQKKKFDVKCVYTETNGFDINTRRWYCYAHVYDSLIVSSNPGDYAERTSSSTEDLTLTGMEDVQAIYEDWDYDECDSENESEARDMASLLIVVKFQDLVRRSVPLTKELAVPIAATGHGYDFIAHFNR